MNAKSKAERARDPAAEQLREALDAAPDGVMNLGRDWRITYLNQRAKEILASSGELLGTVLWESFPGTVYAGSPYVEHYRRAMEQGVAGTFEAYYPEPLNAWFEVMARPVKSGVLLFFRDVTERRKRDDALRASEERYRVLTELSPQSLWTADAQGRVLYANQTFLEYIGKDFVPRNGTEYLNCFYEGDREQVSRMWSHSVETGEDYVMGARLVRARDGAARWWELRALPLRDEAGTIQQWLGMAEDVHESRLAAERLREQYAEVDRLATLVESSQVFIGMYDLERRQFYANPAALRMVGLKSITELEGVEIKEFFFPEDQDFILNDFFPRVLREGRGEVEVRFRHFQTHEPIWMIYHCFTLRDRGGEPTAMATVSRDVTAQKRAETALIQAEKLAAVGRLASSIAHEINNPLEAVTNLLYLARQHAEDPAAQSYLDSADRELRRVAHIANQTLRFHKQSTKPQAISCEELFSTVLRMYEGRLKNANIRVEKRKRAKRQVVCFEGEIRQVLSNLVGNAIDAMPNGGRLLLRSREATEWKSGREGLALTLADTGCGIDRATQESIFQPFFTTKGIGGTGLGLWISAEIVQRHQGRIRVRSSREGSHRGTVFTLFLPFATVAARGSRFPVAG